jgi:hypothetical protein
VDVNNRFTDELAEAIVRQREKETRVGEEMHHHVRTDSGWQENELDFS